VGPIRAQRLGAALFAAGGLAFLSALVWLTALATAWTATCPHEPTGLEKGLSAWPPGAQCPTHDGALFVYQPHPWLKWLSIGIAFAALCVFVVGLVAAIVELRSRRSDPADRVPSAALWT
jgi:hypothetical protein